MDSEWTIQSLIIGELAGVPIEPSYAFYPEFTLSSNSLFYASLLIFGIFVLPIVIAETGFLDNSPKQVHNLDEQGQTIVEAEEAFDRFGAFLKRRFNPTKKMRKAKNIKNRKNYTLPLAIIFVILGSCLIGLPYFLIKDGLLTFDPEAGTSYIKDYVGVIRGQLLLLGILLLVVAIVLIIRFRRNQTKKVT